ncbi:MAG: phosphoribosylamine--glycine ligase [Candidatus Levybacteria bacterium]|nr:phosphoribosylamine--glycine ligase [Candidatus Levybacteria bacterium]
MKERGNTILIVDGGGRGTALVDKYSQSPHVDKILAVPGNDWMSRVSRKPVQIFPEIKTSDVVRIAALANKFGVNLVDIAQEDAVKEGLVDMLRRFKVPAVGPTQSAGRLEWDKNYARSFGQFWKLPQPRYDALNREDQVGKFLDSQENTRWFVKASGLAEGKGAIPATSKQEVLDAIKWLKKEYPEATKVFLIEQWLEGEEFSAFAISDSRNFRILGYAQDHKREYDGDKGDNTGGMGAVSHPLLTNDLELQREVENIFTKTIKAKPGGGYRGILYLGGMAVKANGKLDPYVIEFNARWGDPEAQAIVPGLKVDLFEMGMEAAKGTLRRIKVSDDGKVRVAVAGVAKGYPRSSEYSQAKGKQIFGLDDAEKLDNVIVYGAGVAVQDGKHYVNGGRLFYIVGTGKDVLQARDKAYEAMEKVRIEGNNLHFRTDIGLRDAARLRK